MSKKTFAYIFSRDNITLFADGKTYIVSRQFGQFSQLTEAINDGDFDRAIELANIATAITKQSAGRFTVENGLVFDENGEQIHNAITTRIMDFVNYGIPFAALLVFLEQLRENPSKRAIDELYEFLEHGNMPITPDGSFLAYKSVRPDYRSKTAGSEDVEVSTDGGESFTVVRGNIPNDVGTIVRMKRNLVDDDQNRTCSHGLHVGALSYAGPGGWFNSSGDKVVVVKVNPKNAVSVPADHSAQKLRVCEYEVIADFSGALTEPVFDATTNVFVEPLCNCGDQYCPNPLIVAAAPVAVATPKATRRGKFAVRRCLDCRGRKKSSTFNSSTNKHPRCGGRNTVIL